MTIFVGKASMLFFLSIVVLKYRSYFCLTQSIVQNFAVSFKFFLRSEAKAKALQD